MEKFSLVRPWKRWPLASFTVTGTGTALTVTRMTPAVSSYPLLGSLAVRLEGSTRCIGGGLESGSSCSAAAAPAAEVSVELASPEDGTDGPGGWSWPGLTGRAAEGASGRELGAAGWGLGASGSFCWAIAVRQSGSRIESMIARAPCKPDFGLLGWKRRRRRCIMRDPPESKRRLQNM